MTEQSTASPIYSFIYDPSSYKDARDLPCHNVPIVRATAECLKDYGNLVTDYYAEHVTRVTWPKTTGWRHLTVGSGQQQSVVEGDYVMRWEGDLLYGDNAAVGEIGMGYVTGRTTNENGERSHVLTRDANYHPDGGQVFFSKTASPFVLLLAPASVGDDVKLEDFKAFWFDGSFGFQIAPNVWHQPPYTTDDVAVFMNKQSSVFACVEMDSVKEFGKYLNLPLMPPLESVT